MSRPPSRAPSVSSVHTAPESALPIGRDWDWQEFALAKQRVKELTRETDALQAELRRVQRYSREKIQELTNDLRGQGAEAKGLVAAADAVAEVASKSSLEQKRHHAQALIVCAWWKQRARQAGAESAKLQRRLHDLDASRSELKRTVEALDDQVLKSFQLPGEKERLELESSDLRRAVRELRAELDRQHEWMFSKENGPSGCGGLPEANGPYGGETAARLEAFEARARKHEAWAKEQRQRERKYLMQISELEKALQESKEECRQLSWRLEEPSAAANAPSGGPPQIPEKELEALRAQAELAGSLERQLRNAEERLRRCKPEEEEHATATAKSSADDTAGAGAGKGDNGKQQQAAWAAELQAVHREMYERLAAQGSMLMRLRTELLDAQTQIQQGRNDAVQAALRRDSFSSAARRADPNPAAPE